MKPINKNNEKMCEEFILKNYKYDFETGQIFSKIKNKEIGTVGKRGYKIITIRKNKKLILLKFHRVAYFLFYNKWPEKLIDHINRDKLDNRISNLRLASDQQNKRNQSKHKNNTSGFKNVYKDRKNWRVVFTVDGISKHFGTYPTKEEANEIARKIEKELFKEFAPKS